VVKLCELLNYDFAHLLTICLIGVCAERVTGEPAPLMEGEGRDFRVLGFNHRQRSVFVNVLMR
jgi:hypothetical protein